MTVRIMVGDALSKLAELPDESVHCVVTSPPYWGMRAYTGEAGMIGLEPTFAEHLDNLVAVFREVRRVLRSDGTLWLNYGDSYVSGQGGRQSAAGTLPMEHRHDRPEPRKRIDVDVSTWGERAVAPRHYATRDSGWKPKDLMMMPSSVATAIRDDGVPDPTALRVLERAQTAILDAYDGEPPERAMAALEGLDAEYREAKGRSWWLRSEIIWHKRNPIPESVTDRPTSAHEKMYLLTKSARYFYDADAVQTPCSPNTHHKSGELVAPASSSEDVRFDRRHDFVRTRTPEEEQAAGANLRNVWTIATSPFSEAHFATFPPALVEPCIKAGTSAKGVCGECGAPWVRVVEILDPKGRPGASYHNHSDDLGRGQRGVPDARGAPVRETADWQSSCDHDAPTVPATVLDPFAGAGTVGLVADRLQRDAQLIELSPEYAEMARRRIEDDAGGLFGLVVDLA